ncbi:hypothetical protein QBC37DRAFT_378544 [Rhypophila decipiens]|uniref:Secreted protein n=1 Tax=Rhypophila decipiens TaxID=261697 RepID=A0AAN6XXX8_9PEZI|nr:hypothetical protein QBC37DRAFT_378544 [Rhypophila decipiens]
MKTTSILTSLVAVLGMTTSVSADCFKSGEEWSNKDTALANARKACAEGGLSGSYEPLQRKRACYVHTGRNQKHEFNIYNKNKNDVKSITVDNCALLLSREINGCKHGGRRTEGDWEATSDPNAGAQC